MCKGDPNGSPFCVFVVSVVILEFFNKRQGVSRIADLREGLLRNRPAFVKGRLRGG